MLMLRGLGGYRPDFFSLFCGQRKEAKENRLLTDGYFMGL